MKRRTRTTTALFVVLFVSACAGSITQRADSALATSLAATNAARDSFIEWDRQHQGRIVERAVTKQEAEHDLASYRKRRVRVMRGFSIVYSLIASSASLIPLVEAGKRKDAELVSLIADVVVAVDGIRTAIKEIQE